MKYRFLRFFVGLVFGLLVLSCVHGQTTEKSPALNLKVAFIGDQGLSDEAIAVLKLIKNETPPVAMVLHQGDFDYNDDPDAWENQINQVLGADFPYFASIGNHDTDLTDPRKDKWPEYQQKLKQRLSGINGAVCTGDLGVQSSCVYKGLFFILSGIGTTPPDHPDHPEHVAYIKSELENSSAIWEICSWHANQKAMQIGGKGDEVGWLAYEACRKGGAIIATGHEHSYERTRTLINTEDQTVDPTCSTPNNLCLQAGESNGKTFVFVTGLGGKLPRNQDECLPTTFPYGCNGEWAKIYTSDQGAKVGALFIIFNVDGNPHKARGYFKNIDGEVIDNFEVNKQDRLPPVPPTKLQID